MITTMAAGSSPGQAGGLGAEAGTRERLLDAGIRLIAERGFKATTVGAIEAEAGLVPRSGGLYKHFESKQALIEAALQRQIDEVHRAATTIRDSPSATSPAETLRNIGRIVLEALAREEMLARIIDKEGDRFPEIRDRMADELVTPGYRFTAERLQRWIEAFRGSSAAMQRVKSIDVDAMAAVALSSLINYRRHTWLFGAAPLDVDEERFLEAWVQQCRALFLDPDADANVNANAPHRSHNERPNEEMP